MRKFLEVKAETFLHSSYVQNNGTWYNYEQLLVLLDLPRLSTRRLYLDLLTMYEIIHSLVYYPPNIFTARIGRTPNTARPYLYHCPFAHTNYYKHSFIPHTINTWNTLPLTVVDTSFSLFKSTIWDHIQGCKLTLARSPERGKNCNWRVKLPILHAR